MGLVASVETVEHVAKRAFIFVHKIAQTIIFVPVSAIMLRLLESHM